MEPIKIQYYETPVGELILGSYKDQLCLCDWRYRKMRDAVDSRLQKFFGTTYQEQKSDIIDLTISQLKEYFEGSRKQFDIPLVFAGTDFQKNVWNALLEIPYGRVDSYAGLSKKLNNILAIRAVAAANGANAISIIVPCHRIIGTDGKLIGYAGGLPAKKNYWNWNRVIVSGN